MGFSDQFFGALGIAEASNVNIRKLSKATSIPVARLQYYNNNNIVPSGSHLNSVLGYAGISEFELMLAMGRLDKDILEALQSNAKTVSALIDGYTPKIESPGSEAKLAFETGLGKLYEGDCYELLINTPDDSVDLIFADPPFNLKKLYPSGVDDNLRTEKYIHWCQEWMRECIRVLKPGGSFFLWNLPRWNATLANYLDGRLMFRHWIGVDIKYRLPISGRLYPSHYSMMYYVNGDRPKTFHPDRLPMQTCPHCYGDLKDYGGYKNKMNPLGVNLSDIWSDIPPVRHAKYKRRKGSNELSLKLLDRVIEMASDPGDLVFDPFGGSGTTYVAAELKGRRWLGVEIGAAEIIVDRFSKLDEERDIIDRYRRPLNALFPKKIERERKLRGLWTCSSFDHHAKSEQSELFE